MLRTLTKIVAGIAVLVLMAAVPAYVYLRRSLPAVDGAVTVNGLHGRVEIIRDADAIPHVFASSKADALFGLGYVHAQDRLWQMEFQRRIGFGRLSEIFGAATIPQDRFLRTVGFGRAARAAWNQTPQWAKDQIDGLHRRRERVHRHASRQRTAAGILVASLRARALVGT